MAMYHKNLGPTWKLSCLCKMGVDNPEDALPAILNEQKLRDHSCERRNKSEYYHYKSLHKQVVHKRYAAEKKYMVTLWAVGCTTAGYVGSSGTAKATSCTVTKERDVVGDEAEKPSELEGEDEEVSVDVNRSSSSDALPLLFFLDLLSLLYLPNKSTMINFTMKLSHSFCDSIFHSLPAFRHVHYESYCVHSLWSHMAACSVIVHRSV